jgi:hypothetical protein
VESKLRPLGTSATSGLLYLLRVTVRMENLVEEGLAGETEVLGENLHQHQFVHFRYITVILLLLSLLLLLLVLLSLLLLF